MNACSPVLAFESYLRGPEETSTLCEGWKLHAERAELPPDCAVSLKSAPTLAFL